MLKKKDILFFIIMLNSPVLASSQAQDKDLSRSFYDCTPLKTAISEYNGSITPLLKLEINTCREGCQTMSARAINAMEENNYEDVKYWSDQMFMLRSLHVYLLDYRAIDPLKSLIRDIRDIDKAIHIPLWKKRKELMRKTDIKKIPSL